MGKSPFWRATAPATDAQMAFLRDLQGKRHVTDDELCALAGAASLTELNKGQASALIGLMLPEERGELQRRLATIRGQLPLVEG